MSKRNAIVTQKQKAYQKEYQDQKLKTKTKPKYTEYAQ